MYIKQEEAFNKLETWALNKQLVCHEWIIKNLH